MGQPSKVKMKETIIIQVGTFEKARKDLKAIKEKNPRKLIGFTGTDDDTNRKILEKLNVDIFMPLQHYRKDFQKQRNSGLNQVLAKIAKKNNIKIGINLDEIINNKDKTKAEIIARVKQNIKLCSKNKLQMKFCGASTSKKGNYDLKALGLSLGMPTWMTKNLF